MLAGFFIRSPRRVSEHEDIKNFKTIIYKNTSEEPSVVALSTVRLGSTHNSHQLDTRRSNQRERYIQLESIGHPIPDPSIHSSIIIIIIIIIIADQASINEATISH
jgi:hypothetical protein